MSNSDPASHWNRLAAALTQLFTQWMLVWKVPATWLIDSFGENHLLFIMVMEARGNNTAMSHSMTVQLIGW